MEKLQENQLSKGDAELLGEFDSVIETVLLNEEYSKAYKDEIQYADELARELDCPVGVIALVDYKYKIFDLGKFTSDFELLRSHAQNGSM